MDRARLAVSPYAYRLLAVASLRGLMNIETERFFWVSVCKSFVEDVSDLEQLFFDEQEVSRSSRALLKAKPFLCMCSLRSNSSILQMHSTALEPVRQQRSLKFKSVLNILVSHCTH